MHGYGSIWDGSISSGARSKHVSTPDSVVASAPGHRGVTTHVFDAASPHLDSDAVFGVRPSLVVDMEGGHAEFDIVLDQA